MTTTSSITFLTIADDRLMPNKVISSYLPGAGHLLLRLPTKLRKRSVVEFSIPFHHQRYQQRIIQDLIMTYSMTCDKPDKTNTQWTCPPEKPESST